MADPLWKTKPFKQLSQHIFPWVKASISWSHSIIKMPEPTVSKLPELVIFDGPLPKSQFSAVSATILHANVTTGNSWPKVHGQLCQTSSPERYTKNNYCGILGAVGYTWIFFLLQIIKVYSQIKRVKYIYLYFLYQILPWKNAFKNELNMPKVRFWPKDLFAFYFHFPRSDQQHILMKTHHYKDEWKLKFTNLHYHKFLNFKSFV